MCKPLVADFGRESQFPRAKGLVFQPQFAVGGIVAVLAVAQNRAADVCQVCADLMRAPGHKLHFQQSQPPADGQRFIAGNNLFRTARRRVGNAHNAALGVF